MILILYVRLSIILEREEHSLLLVFDLTNDKRQKGICQ